MYVDATVSSVEKVIHRKLILWKMYERTPILNISSVRSVGLHFGITWMFANTESRASEHGNRINAKM